MIMNNANKKTIKYGVVGLGRGLDIAKEGIRMEGAKLCAACDINPEKIKKAKEKLEEKGLTDCTFYSDYDEMLKSDIDAVIVATEAIYHVPFVKKAMEAGKHVLSEIPAIGRLSKLGRKCASRVISAISCMPRLNISTPSVPKNSPPTITPKTTGVPSIPLLSISPTN